MQQIDTNIPILRALQDLGALSDNYGLYDIKPFKDWEGSAWADKIFTFRLINAGETLDILKGGADLTGEALDQYKKFELLSRAIWAINQNSLITEEDVISYNEIHKTQITMHEYLTGWMRNLEDIVLNRLFAVYSGLQFKQVRMLQGTHACEECGQTYKNIPKGSAELKYSLSEIICPQCLPRVDITLRDVKEDFFPTHTVNTPTDSSEQKSSHLCNCGKEFEDIESYRTHIAECKEYQS